MPGAVSLGVLKSFRSSGVFMKSNIFSKSFQDAPGKQKKHTLLTTECVLYHSLLQIGVEMFDTLKLTLQKLESPSRRKA